jgi:hypothetical protein
MLLVVTLALHGPCDAGVQAGRTNAPCTRETDCQEGLICPPQVGLCVSPDASLSDVGGKFDSGASDAAADAD